MKPDSEFDQRLRSALGAIGDKAIANEHTARQTHLRSPSPVKAPRLLWAFALASAAGLSFLAFSISSRDSRASVGTASDPLTTASVVERGTRTEGGVTALAIEGLETFEELGASENSLFDPLVGQPAPKQLVAAITASPAVVGLVAPTCQGTCRAKVEKTVMEISTLGVTGYLVEVGEAQMSLLSSSSDEDRPAQLVFIAADSSIVGREWFDVDSLDSSRSGWLTSLAQTSGSSPSTTLAVPDQPASRFVAVDGSGQVFEASIPEGSMTSVLAADQTIERAWTIGSTGRRAISTCCEPANGRIVLVPDGEGVRSDSAAFDASGLGISSDGAWILTQSPSPGVWNANSPFDSSSFVAVLPGDPPRAVAWVPGEARIVALRTADETAFADIVGVNLAEETVVRRNQLRIPNGTADLSVNVDGDVLALINELESSKVDQIEPSSGKVLATLELPEGGQSISVDASGRRLLVLDTQGSANVFDAETFEKLAGPIGSSLKSAEW